MEENYGSTDFIYGFAEVGTSGAVASRSASLQGRLRSELLPAADVASDGGMDARPVWVESGSSGSDGATQVTVVGLRI